jgi:hypothetical protein
LVMILVFMLFNFVSLFWPSVNSHLGNSFLAFHRGTAGNPARYNAKGDRSG